MKAVIFEKSHIEFTTKNVFKRLGFETSSIYNENEKYDVVYIHHDGNFDRVDKIKSQQPSCITIGYSSVVTEMIPYPKGSLGEEFKKKMENHYDETLYWDENLWELIKKIVQRKKNILNND